MWADAKVLQQIASKYMETCYLSKVLFVVAFGLVRNKVHPDMATVSGLSFPGME